MAYRFESCPDYIMEEWQSWSIVFVLIYTFLYIYMYGNMFVWVW